MNEQYALGETALSVKQLRKSDPQIKAIDMSRKLGVSRERIRQLLVRFDLPTHFRTRITFTQCIDCGKEIRSTRSKSLTLRCMTCHKLYRRILRTAIKCDWCGCVIERLPSQVRQVKFFFACSQSHWGKIRRGKFFRDGTWFKNGEYKISVK